MSFFSMPIWKRIVLLISGVLVTLVVLIVGAIVVNGGDVRNLYVAVSFVTPVKATWYLGDGGKQYGEFRDGAIWTGTESDDTGKVRSAWFEGKKRNYVGNYVGEYKDGMRDGQGD